MRRVAVNLPDWSVWFAEPDRLSVLRFGVKPAKIGTATPAAGLPATDNAPVSFADFVFGSYFAVSVSVIGTSATDRISTVPGEFAVPAPGVYGVSCARHV